MNGMHSRQLPVGVGVGRFWAIFGGEAESREPQDLCVYIDQLALTFRWWRRDEADEMRLGFRFGLGLSCSMPHIVKQTIQSDLASCVVRTSCCVEHIAFDLVSKNFN